MVCAFKGSRWKRVENARSDIRERTRRANKRKKLENDVPLACLSRVTRSSASYQILEVLRVILQSVIGKVTSRLTQHLTLSQINNFSLILTS